MNKILSYLPKALDFLNKNINRLKTLGTAILIFSFILSLGGNGCQRSKVAQLANRFAELDFKNILLRKNLNESDSTNVVLENKNDSLSVVITELKDKAKVLKKRGDSFQANLRAIKDSLINVPTDSSYAFLQAAYPYPGDYKYPFNEPQVRNIHLDYLENNELWFLTANLELQVDNCQNILALNTELSSSYSKQVDNFKFQKVVYEDIIVNKDTEIDLLQDDVKDEKRGKGFWKVVSGVLAVAAIIIAL